MFEFLHDEPKGVVVEAVYQAMRRIYVRAPHQDRNDGLAPGTEETPDTRALRAILREIREAEGVRISQLSDEAASRYTQALADVLKARRPPLTPEDERRALATLEEMRRTYGQAA
ncbi:MAG TPA: hypothetical protein VJT67_02555 [Longimicrobiaceae bacterium]|nr:hypothetical protein [Longimicrobiaceae bacterium]